MKDFARYLVIYWAIGCGLLGLALGDQWNHCPNDKTTLKQMVTYIVIGPAVVTYAMVATKGPETCGK